ncbi:MAG: ion transporter [Lachnospiraceae bacterium]|nr:ion transporter [Lachnospiraceae bacterium]
MSTEFRKIQDRIYRTVEIGYTLDTVSRAYDIVSVVMILVNLIASIAYTFDSMEMKYGPLLLSVEAITVAFFAVDYVLRILSAPAADRGKPKGKMILQYMLSFNGIVDLLSFLPYYLPVFFPAGAVAFRMFRVIRIFRLFRINAYYDSLNVITSVLNSKKQQLMSSVFIIIILMLASSLCMYSVENKAQPDVFSNAFSGIWWATSTLLTVGYGDIYPITTAGKILGILISFLGVGMVAIPTGIISAGFVEQYTMLQRVGEQKAEMAVRFIRVRLTDKDNWVGRKIMNLGLPEGIIIAAIRRGTEFIVPRGEIALEKGDNLVLAAEGFNDGYDIDLNEIQLKPSHPWCGHEIRELDISRQTFIVAIDRNGTPIIPSGRTRLLAGDIVILYTRRKIAEAVRITI